MCQQPSPHHAVGKPSTAASVAVGVPGVQQAQKVQPQLPAPTPANVGPTPAAGVPPAAAAAGLSGCCCCGLLMLQVDAVQAVHLQQQTDKHDKAQHKNRSMIQSTISTS